MHYFEYINRDTTIYSGGTTSSLNAGHDEILEVVKEVSSDGSTINVSRILLSADYSYVSKSIFSTHFILNLLILKLTYILRSNKNLLLLLGEKNFSFILFSKINLS